MKKSQVRQIIREEIITELQRGIWLDASKKELEMFKKEIFDLIKQTYKPLGGHPNIKSPSDITSNDISKWELINLDADPAPDAVSGAKIKPAGNKLVVGATDGTNVAKKAYLHSRINALKRSGNYIEVSHKLADILIAKGVPIVSDENRVKQALKKDITWHGKLSGKNGDGWYSRKIAGSTYEKIMLGNPKVR